jgi:serine/threonine-protein kinase
MASKQKFGKFVLLEEIETSGLGTEFRAAKLGPSGLEKIVALLRLGKELSGHAEVAKALMEQTKIAAALQNPNILKIYGIGKVDWAYYVSYEFVEGKSLKAILKRCRQEHFPFSTDHALLVASKVCTALEFAHGRRAESGGRYFHGLLNPSAVQVSYEGEVRTRGFGQWPARVREAGGVTDEDLLYLAPEQDAGGAGDPRCDIFAVGAILYEALSGQALFQNGRDIDVPAALAHARLQSASGDDDALPRPLVEILLRALARDPAARYAEVQELRKAIDMLLFSGDFTPTTFNLAFFMHSLFREDIERESRQIKEEKEASYLEYLTEEPRAARPGAATVKGDTGEFAVAPPTPSPEAAATVISPARPTAPTPAPAAERPAGEAAPAAPHAEAPVVSARDAAAAFTFHKDEKSKSRLPLIAGVVLLAVAGGAAAWFLTRGGGTAPTPAASPTVNPEVAAREAHIRDLEARLKAMEEERRKAEQAAADEAKRKLEAQAKAKGQAVDPAALAKAQEEAAKKARAEQERKAEEERKRLEAEKLAEEQRLEEQRRAEEARKAEEAKKAEEAAAAAAATPTPPPVTQPVIRPGTLVNLSDPGVMAPVVEKQPQIVYPPLALRQNVEGDVELNALIDEKGAVVDVQIVRGAGGRAGLNEAAIENVKRRKYRPATKDGVPVKVWVPVRVQFKLPR